MTAGLMPEYTSLTVLAIGAAVAIDMVLLRTRSVSRLTFWISVGLMFFFQVGPGLPGRTEHEPCGPRRHRAFVGNRDGTISATIHRLIGHGVAWPIHRSHHEGPVRGPEVNDIIPAVSALVTVAMFSVGVFNSRFTWTVPIAAGVTLYGAAYFAVHDLYIHRRLRVFPTYVRWLEPFKAAHLEHHLHQVPLPA